MFYAHIASWPEIATLLAALGLVANASAGFYRLKKSARERGLQPLRMPARRGPNHKPRF